MIHLAETAYIRGKNEDIGIK